MEEISRNQFKQVALKVGTVDGIGYDIKYAESKYPVQEKKTLYKKIPKESSLLWGISI